MVFVHYYKDAPHCWFTYYTMEEAFPNGHDSNEVIIYTADEFDSKWIEDIRMEAEEDYEPQI